MLANLLERSLRNPQLIISAWQLVDIGAATLTLFITTYFFHETFEPRHWRLLLTVIASMLLIYSLSDLYFRRRTRFLLEDAYLLLIEWSKVLMVILALGYLSGAHNEFSRSMMLSWALAAYFAQLIVHIIIQAMLRSLRRHGITSRRALVVGAGPSLTRFVELLKNNSWLGINAIGYVSEDKWAAQAQRARPSSGADNGQAAAAEAPLPRLGELRDINALVRTHSIDDVYIALPTDQLQTLENFALHLLNCPATVSWVPGITMTGAMSTRADSIAGQPLISLSDSPLRGGQQTLKRVLDLTLSLLGIVLLSPLLLLITALVKMTSTGPVLFKQKRRGIGGSTIEVWKFRTMWQAPEGEEPKQATADDERITPLGRFLRRWSLDELPQLFNVIQGHMSLVGPRPHALWLDNEFEHEIDLYRQRNKVKPGITGLAQVNGHRGETETRAKMALRLQDDIYYINHWSIWLDIKILLLTIPAIFSKTNAV